MPITLADIQANLEEPFAIADIDLLPKGKIEREGKTLCMGLPYADKRVYEDRLNKLAPGEWSTPPPLALVAGQKLIVYVTVVVCGVVHTDVGEASTISENGKPSENAATESYAQAFKRACSQFGLGRYLYGLEKAWVPFNAQKKQIDLKPAEIQAVVRRMYSEAHIGTPALSTAQPTITPVQQAKEMQAKATPQQIASIDTLCQHLGKASPVTGETTLDQAKELIKTLSAEVKDAREMKRQQPAPQPAATQKRQQSSVPLPPQDPALRKMIATSKARCGAVQVLWEDAKTDAKLANVTDEQLTVQQVVQINNVIAQYSKKLATAS